MYWRVGVHLNDRAQLISYSGLVACIECVMESFYSWGKGVCLIMSCVNMWEAAKVILIRIR